ncbi:MAG: calcium-translocating P-type ATPase, PMCA-type [Ruminococcaceae bacterium]|nr:calcium-translocating P-type ATPase, PMCA-type [Oscillospiraceae bacterium]
MTKQQEKAIYGQSEAQAQASREKYGANRLPVKPPKPFYRMVLENLSDPIIKILLGALALNLLFTYRHINWAENIGILMAVVIATLVSSLSERGGEKAFQKMNELAGGQMVFVYREGVCKQLPSEELTVGDYIQIGAGERVPCDGRLVSGKLSVDQSTLNGESAPAKKYPCEGGDGTPDDMAMLFTGSTVLKGSGVFVAQGVGEHTLYGGIAGQLQEERRESPMKSRLSALARTISRMGYIAAAAVGLTYFVSALVRGCTGTAEIIARLSDLSFVFSHLVSALTVAITVVVVAVPEGLPMMLTVILCANMKRMYRDNVLTRKPIGIETAGSMNILFCDKTGTLTTGHLTMEALYLGDLSCFASATSLRQSPLYPHFALQAFYNTEAYIHEGRAVGGNATERALLDFIIRGKPSGVQVTDRLPFDSAYKFSAVSLSGLREPLCLYKGASEVLLGKCRSYLSADGSVCPLTNTEKVQKSIDEAAMGMGRVIFFCYGREMPKGEVPPDDLTMLGYALLRDEIRRGVPEAIRKMTKAGVQTVMVTGDSRQTAAAIAQRLGMLSGGDEGIMEGAALKDLSDSELSALLPKLRVVARALPGDKSRLVRLAQEMGLVAGMTGDGVNDAPALRMADVGFAMGSGTDVAKQAGDIVILDDNFISILRAVLYGRTIFRSVRKFIVFQLTMNLMAVGVSLFGQLAGIRTPVTVIQMLWVNIIMDTLGGLAFAGEAPCEVYLKEKPKHRNSPILNGNMIKRTIIMGGYCIGMATLFLYSPRMRAIYRYGEDPTRLLTAFFALFIFCGIVICFTARSDGRGIFSGLIQNKAFGIIMTAIFIVQLAMLYYGGSVFRCVPLSPKELGYSMLFALTVLPVNLFTGLFLKLGKKQTKGSLRGEKAKREGKKVDNLL